MITPRLFRRSLRRSLRWRVLLLWWAALAIPGAIAAAPVFAFFRAQLDRATVAREVVAWMDGATLLELLRELAEDGNARSMLFAAAAAAFVLLVCAPFVAGAMVASARAEDAVPFPRVLAGAGGLYGRMLRTALAGLVPLGISAAVAAGAFKLAADAAGRSTTETAANRDYLAASCAAAVAVFLAHLVLDAARAQFAADDGRRSAIAALWSGLRLVARRPIRAVGIGALGTGAGLGSALLLMALRLQIAQRGPFAIALAWLLAQGAQVAIGYGRAVRIEGLSELSRADVADRRSKESAAAAGSLPATEVVHSTTLDALGPPRSGAAR